MRRALVIGVMFVAVAGIFSCGLQADIGVGIKLIGAVPFVTVNSQWGGIGAEAGMGGTSCSFLGANLFMVWYCVDGKYYVTLPVLGEALQPYFGGGIIGVTANSSLTLLGTELTLSASATGGHVLGGLEYSFASQGLPLVIAAGANYVSINKMELTATVDGETQTIELPADTLDISGLGVHLGIQWVF